MDNCSDSDMEILNLVHQLAAHRLDTPIAAATSNVDEPFARTSPSDLQSTNHNFSNKTSPKIDVRKMKEESRSGRRIQPVSIPRKPPDIQNLALFPPIANIVTPPTSISSTCTLGNLKSSSEITENLFMDKAFDNNNFDNSLISSSDLKLKQLESKLRGQGSRDIRAKLPATPVKARQWKAFNSPSPQKSKPMLTSSSGDIKPRTTPTKEPRKAPRSAELFSELTPDVIKEVDSIAEKFSSLMDKNLCRSILEELTFLLKLISSCGGAQCVSMERIGRLSTVAQQVYFVIKVLSLQIDTSLTAIDPKIIQLLVQKYPHRMPKLIRKHFEKWATSQLEKKELVERDDLSTQKPSEYHQCVTFHSETDGRSNFPNQGDFHAFCKQRDLFYSIKNLWTEKEQTNFTNTVAAPPAFNRSRRNDSHREPDPLYPKIKALFNMNSSWSNLSHMAALFSSQYLLDSFEQRQSPNEETIKDEQMSNLLRSNPNRLAQLQNRMSTATIACHSTIGARNEDPLTFSKYFLTIANSPGFNQHLIDRITFEISQIEASIESSESFQPKETELLIRKCNLLAKLLGYLVFLPYNDDGPNNRPHQSTATLDKEAVVSKQIELRSYLKPPIDLRSKLIMAVRESRLTFTLPWVIEFLSMADSISLQLPIFKEIIGLICSIYRAHLKISSPLTPISSMNLNFLRFWCGRFFAMEKFPCSLLYSKDDDAVLNDMRMMVSGNRCESQPSAEDQTNMDLCDALGDKLIELNFASEFNKLANILHAGLQQQETNLGTNSTTLEVKHIRPVPAKSPVQSINVCKTIQLQRQLESSFFDSNSPSVKKTVDFIAERIASNYVKTLRSQMSEERSKLTELGIFEDNAASACRKIMSDQLQEFSETKCRESVNILIGDSISRPALYTCQKIALRKCTEKVNEWIASHIKSELFPAIELPTPATSVKATKNEPVKKNDNAQENGIVIPDVKSNFEIMILLHRSLKKLHQGKPITENSIDDIITSNALLNEPALACTIIDFGMALITFCPSMLTLKRQDQLAFLWKKHWNQDCKLLTPRNLMMMQDSGKWTKESWKILTNLGKSLINHKVINFETLEQDSLNLLRQDWTTLLFSHLSLFLKELVSSFKTTTVREHESTELIDWVAWYCSNEFDELIS